MKKIILLVLCTLAFSLSGFAQKNKPKSSKSKTSKTTSAAKPKEDTAPSVTLSPVENEILAEINALRADPQTFVQYLEQMKNGFKGKIFKNAQGVEFATIEGTPALDDAIEALKKQSPLSPVKISDGLVKAAVLHLQDMTKNDFFGHRGSDQTLPDERAAMFGSAPSGVNENLTQGSVSAREIVLQMLISDGLASRSQRQNLLNPQLKVVGISAGGTRKGFLCVLLLAEVFKEKT